MLRVHFAISFFFICFFILFVYGDDEHCQDSFLGDCMEHKWKPSHEKFDLWSDSKGNLTATPNIIQNGQDVTVRWENVENADSNDWIAIFCPGSEGTDQDYLDYRYTNSTSSSGSIIFRNLINMRCNYGFRYYRASQENGRYPLVAISNEIQFNEGKNQVLQVHASLTSNPTEMQITWVTGSNQYDSIVYYGTSKTELTNRVSSPSTSSITYTADQMCGSPANVTSQQTFRNPGWIHSVILTGLEPNSFYFYKCGNENEGWSEIFWIRTNPSSDNFTDSETAEINTKWIIYGDMGVRGPPASQSTASRVTNEITSGSQLVLHIGDISYARGYAYIWEQFFSLIESIASHVPYMINIGNHEYDHTTGGQNDPSGAADNGFHPVWGNYGDDSSGECSVPMYYRFFAPDNGNDIYWYSFDFGNVHFIMMSTEHNYTKTSEQYNWIENDLKQVNRNRTPFIVFGGHRAMYESELFLSEWAVALGLRESLEDLLYQYQVDVAFWGHYHAYERSCPVYKGNCNTDGTTHIVVGTAGAWLDGYNYYTQQPWTEKFISNFGYCRVTTTRDEMTIQFIHNENGSIGDEVVLPARF